MSLDPLRAAFLAQATADADRILAQAAQEARGRVAAAGREAAAIVARARREGEAEAEREAARARTAAERNGRSLALEARREVCDAFREQARAAAQRLRDDPAYPALLDRLERAARAQLGDGAEVERDAAGVGGVRARRGGRAVDYSLAALVDRCVDALGPHIEELWR